MNHGALQCQSLGNVAADGMQTESNCCEVDTAGTWD